MRFQPETLIGPIFDCVTDDTALPSLAAALATEVNAASSKLMIYGPTGVKTEFMHGLCEQAEAAYVAHYWSGDIWAEAYSRCPFDVVEVSDTLVREDVFISTELYNDLMRPIGNLSRFMGSRTDLGGGNQLVLGWHRARTQSQFEPEVVARAQTLQPLILHLTKARRRAAVGWGRIAERLLDAEADAVAVVGPTGRVIYANAAARSAFAGSGPLCLAADRVSARDAGFARTLARAIAWACSGRGGQVLDLRRPEGANGRPWRVAVDPLDGADAGLACVRLRDEEAWLRAGVDAAALAWSLSPAERALAEAVLKGLSPAEHADRRGVALSTVRTQVRHLFAKAGVSGNGELVTALLSAAGR